MKGNGHDTLPELPENSMQQIPQDAVMDCDFCGVPMNFQEYMTHDCPGLSGRNPFAEKMAKAKWKLPGQDGYVEDTRGFIGGQVRATGSIVGHNPRRLWWARLFYALVIGSIVGVGIGLMIVGG